MLVSVWVFFLMHYVCVRFCKAARSCLSMRKGRSTNQLIIIIITIIINIIIIIIIIIIQVGENNQRKPGTPAVH